MLETSIFSFSHDVSFILLGLYFPWLLKPRMYDTKRVRVHIHQPSSRTFFVFFAKVCKLECKTHSDWLDRMI